MKNILPASLLVLLCAFPPFLNAEDTDHVTQYGITWTFNKPHTVGTFVTGDYWVIGPVNIVSVSPTPGPAAADEQKTKTAKSRYGAAAISNDKRMRNGSMIIMGRDLTGSKAGAGFGNQGYDSRGLCFTPESSITFPHVLDVNQSLISSVSSESYGKDGKLETPFVLADLPLKNCGKTMQSAMQDAAILTCLDQAPPADAFRPAYAGKDKTIYETKDIKWDLLPKLRAPSSTPSWPVMERIFQRPWLDHLDSWAYQYNFPALNQPGYGREFVRMTSMASLMLMLDVPQSQKEKLMYEFLQLGIDQRGLSLAGRTLLSEQGGHFIGRKWPILFTSIMFGNEGFRTFPELDLSLPVMGNYRLTPTVGGPPPTAVFGEDVDTYYGKGGDGQKVLNQITVHTGQRFPYEEKPRAEFTKDEKWIDGYRIQNAVSWNGTALAALLMKAKAMWNHDAFFDYVDRMMGPEEPDDVFPKWLPAKRSIDAFTQDMWDANRKDVPEQPGGKDNLKFLWNDHAGNGHFEANPKDGPYPPSLTSGKADSPAASIPGSLPAPAAPADDPNTK